MLCGHEPSVLLGFPLDAPAGVRRDLRWSSCSAVSALVVGLALCASGTPPRPGRPQGVTPRPVLPPGADAASVPAPYVGSTVAGLMVSLDASLVSAYGGEDKDVIKVDIQGQGPTRFSLPRWNQGDYAPRLQPRRPFSQPNLGHVVDLGGDKEEDPGDLPAQAWRPSIERGVVVGSVAQNGCKWNDSARDFYGTLACVYDSHGFGYSMDTGEFGNPNPNIDIAVGKLGLFLEGNLDTAVAWFPYDQGWVAGYVGTPGEYSAGSAVNKWTSAWSFAPSLPEDAAKVVRWDGDGALLTLPGVDSARDGMLFLTSTNPNPGNNDLNTVSTFPTSQGWRVQVREDDQPIPTIFCLPDQAMFAFLYIPYHAGGLIGGHVDGTRGVPVISRGSFSVRRQSEGVYLLSLSRSPGLGYFADSQPLSNRDGMLLLQVVGKEPGLPRFARHTVLSYKILPSGGIQVESHRLERESGGGVDTERYPPADCDFYFAWLDFRTPLTPTQAEFEGRVPGEGPPWSEAFFAGFSAALYLAVAVLALGLAAAAAWSQSALWAWRRHSLLAHAPLPQTTRALQEDDPGTPMLNAVEVPKLVEVVNAVERSPLAINVEEKRYGRA